MITINIGGGLGNQLFQYATARGLSLKYDQGLTLDISSYPRQTKDEVQRKYQLDLFQVKADALILNSGRVNRIIRFLSRLILRPLNSEGQLVVFGLLLRLNLPVYLTRNFQKEKYFFEAREILLKEISLKEPMKDRVRELAEKIENNKNSVSLHVRRTDILDPKNLYGNICDIPYYNKAIVLIKEKVNNPTFFIFSDDIAWCKENFKFSDPTFFVSNSGANDLEELMLMSKCHHNIIANSTFSWWGAWLNQNNDKIVVAPRQWRADKTADEVEILPKSWAQI